MEPIRLDPGGLPFETSRSFKLSGYVFSHGLLLLRSNKVPGLTPTRLEVLFQDTRFVCLPEVMDGLHIRLGDNEVVRPHFSNLGPMEFEYGVSTFEVGGNGWKGFIVAGSAWMLEDDTAGNQPSRLR